MNCGEFKELLYDERYEIEDFKYPNMPFTRFNHLIHDKKTGRRFMTVHINKDEIGFIEVYCRR